LNIHEASTNQVLNDMEELASTHEGYRQQGRETTNKNPNSLNLSQKSTQVRTKPRRSGLEMRKTSAESSFDGADKDPTKKNLEKYHIIYTSTKRKREMQKTGLDIPKTHESPLEMDLDELIE
jgi:hypothetical protein